MLGGLIKGIGGIFGLDSPAELSGFKAGLAGSISKGIDKSVDRYADRVDRIADYQLRKRVAEEERFTSEYQENIKKLKAMKGQMGDAGVEGLAYLVSTYGIDGAEDEIKNLRALADSGFHGSSETALLRLEKNPDFNTSLSDLAKFSTRPIGDISKATEGVEAPGIMGLFGADFSRDVQKNYDAAAKEIGLGTDRTEIGLDTLPTAKGMDPILRGTLSDPLKEAARIQYIAKQRLEEAEKLSATNPEAAEAMKEDSLKLLTRADTISNIFDTGKGSVATERANINFFAGLIGEAYGLGGRFSGGVYTTEGMDRENAGNLAKVSGQLNVDLNKAIDAGIKKDEALSDILSAIQSGRSIAFDPESKTLIASDIALFVPASAGGEQNGGDRTVIDTRPTSALSQAEIISQHRVSGNDLAKQEKLKTALIRKIMREQSIPATERDKAVRIAEELLAGQP